MNKFTGPYLLTALQPDKNKRILFNIAFYERCTKTKGRENRKGNETIFQEMSILTKNELSFWNAKILAK